MLLKYIIPTLLLKTQKSQAWLSQEGNYGDCGVLPNFQDLQEANYAVHYYFNDKWQRPYAKVAPIRCQKDIDDDIKKYDNQQKKLRAREEKKKKKQEGRETDKAVKKKNKKEEKKVETEKEEEEQQEGAPEGKKIKKVKGSRGPNKDSEKTEKPKKIKKDKKKKEPETEETPEEESFDFGGLNIFRKRRSIRSKRGAKKPKTGGFDRLKGSRIGTYACHLESKKWVEVDPILEKCGDDLAEDNADNYVEINAEGNHIIGGEAECPRNKIWDFKKNLFEQNPCTIDDVNSLPMVGLLRGNARCLNARSLLQVNDDETYTFNGFEANLQGIPCGFSLRDLVHVTTGKLVDKPVFKKIILTKNDIKHLPCSFFYNIAVSYLDISNNGLIKICPNLLAMGDVIYNSEHLKTLYMSGNKFENDDLPDDFFSYVPSLDSLRLAENRLTSINSNWLASVPVLKALNFGQNNIDTLPEDIFANNLELQHILLYRNDIKILPANLLKDLSNLRRVWFNRNNVNTIPDDFFSGNPLIAKIYFADNKLRNVQNSLFQGFSQLSEIELSGNSCEVNMCSSGLVLKNTNECSCS